MPNGGRIDFQVGFKTDKSGLNQLNKIIQDLQGKLANTANKNGMSDSLRKATDAAKELQKIINGSWNDKLQQLNVNKFNTSINKAFGSASNLRDILVQSGKDGTEAFLKISSQVLSTNTQLKQSNKLLDDMADTFGKTVKYGIASSVFNNIKNSLQQAFYFAKDLDLSLTNIRIVTGDSADQMERFAKSANQTAKTLGRSTLDYTNAALTYYQQGLGQEDVQARTEATMMAQNITGVGTQMADYLTAVWNGYKVSAEQAIGYVDKLAAVADSSASDMSQLAIAMSKVASAANVMGVDSDQLNAQLATVIATTRQAPESIGTAFKTIYARINDIKAGTDQAEISLGNYSGKMASLGFNVFDINGKLKDTGDVIEEVGERWGTLSKEQQVYLAQVMGGTRQYSRLISLFDNWNMYSEMLNVSLNSQGTLLEKNGRYLDSVKAHLESLNTEAERTYMILSDTGAINAVADALNVALTSFNNFLSGLGGGITSITYMGSLVAGVFSKQIAKGIQDAKVQLDQFFSTERAQKAQKKWAEATVLVTNAMNGGNINSKSAGYKAQIEQALKLQKVASALTEEEQKKASQLQRSVGLHTELLVKAQEEQRQAEQTRAQYSKLYQQYKQNKYSLEEGVKLEEQKSKKLSQTLSIFGQINQIQTRGQDLDKNKNAALDLLQKKSSVLRETWKSLGLTEQEIEDNFKDIKQNIKDGNDYLENNRDIYESINDALQKSNLSLEQKKMLLNAVLTDTSQQQQKQRQILEAEKQRLRILKEMAEQRQKTQKIVQSISAIGQVLSAVAGAAKVFGDESVTGAEKANAAFSTVQGTISAIGTYIGGPFGTVVASTVNSILSLIKEVTPLGKVMEDYFSSTEEKLQKIKDLHKEIDKASQDHNKSKQALKDIQEEYDKLTSKSGSLTNAEQERLNELAEIFNNYSDGVILGYNQQGDAIISKNKKIEDTLTQMDKQYEAILRNNQARMDISAEDKVYKQAVERRKALSGNTLWTGEGSQLAIDSLVQGIRYNLEESIFTDQNANMYQTLVSKHGTNGPKIQAILEQFMNKYANASDINELSTMAQPLKNIKTLVQNFKYSSQREEQLEKTQVNGLLSSLDTLLTAIGSLQDEYDTIDNTVEESSKIDTGYVFQGLRLSKEYSSFKKQAGDKLWNNGMQKILDDIITTLAEEAKRSEDTPTGDAAIEQGQEYLANLLTIFDPKVINQAMQNQQKTIDNIIEQNGKISVGKLIQQTKQTATSLYESLINEQSTQQQKEAVVKLLNMLFGFDITTGTSELGNKVNDFVKTATDLVTEKAKEKGIDYTPTQQETQAFTSFAKSLPEAELDMKLTNIDEMIADNILSLTNLVDAYKTAGNEISNFGNAIDFSWDNQIKLSTALEKIKSYSNIEGANDFLSFLEANNPKLKELASKQGGRYGELYVQEYNRIIRQNKEKEIKETEARINALQKRLNTYKSKGVSLESTKVENITTELGSLQTQLIQQQSDLARLTEETNQSLDEQNEKLEKQVSLLENLKQNNETNNNALSAYDKLKSDSGSKLSDKESAAIEDLTSRYTELAQAEEKYGFGTVNYMYVLKDVLKLEQERVNALQAQSAEKLTFLSEIDEQDLQNKIDRIDNIIANNQKKVTQIQKQYSAEVSRALQAGLNGEQIQTITDKYSAKIKEISDNIDKFAQKKAKWQEIMDLLKENPQAAADALQALGMTVDGLEEKYVNLSDKLNGLNGFYEKLSEGAQLSKEELVDFGDLLDSIQQQYDGLDNTIETLRKTWMSGTEQYSMALQELQSKLTSLSLQQAYDKLTYDANQVEHVFVQIDDGAFQSWKEDVEQFFEDDKTMSITVDSALDQEVNKIKKDFDEIYSAASKIGEGFKVSASDIGEITRVFPEITQGMMRFADGSYQLNQQVVQQAISAAQAEVAANGEAITAKLQQQADYHNAKADIYDQIAAIAAQMAENQVMTEEDKNQRIGQINGLLSQLQEQNKGKVVEYQKKASDEIKVKEQDTATHRQSINANMYRSLTEMSNARAQQDVANTQAMFDADQARANNMRPADYVAGNGLDAFNGRAPIQSSYSVIDPGSTAQDTFTINPDFGTYSAQDWRNLQSQAKARAEQERRLAELAMSKYYDVLGKANKTIYGLGNVGRGEGIEGAKPEKEEKAKEEKIQEPPDPNIEKYLKDEFDRYHDINIIIQRINRQLKNMQSQQKKLVGKDLIHNYQKQLELLNQQIEAQKQKMSIAQQEAGELRASLSAQGLAFQENGQIANYLGVLSAKQNAINEYIGFYNSLTKEEQEYAKDVLDSMKQQYEDLKKDIARYDEIVNTMIPDLADQIREETQKKVEIAISKSKMAVDIKIDMSQLQRDYNKFIKNIKKQVQDWDILGNTKFAFKDLQSFFKDGIYNSTKAQTEQLYFLMDQIRQINQSGFSSVYGDNKKQALDDLNQYRESLEDDLQSVLDLIEQIKQNIIKAIEQVQEGFENRQKYYDHISGLLDHDLKLVELIYGDKAYQKMQNLYKMQYENDLKHLVGLREEEQYWDKQLQQEREHQKNLEKDSNAWHESQERIKKFEQNWMDATNRLNSAFSSSIQNIINEYQTGVEKIYHDLELQLFNGHSFEYIQEEWELAKKQSDMYLDNINRSYALDKLNNGYDKLSEKTKGNLKAQRQINAAREAELGTLRQKEKITQGQIDVATRRLQILEMQIALEDSRNNKSTLQLRRDSQGNYSYQYAADADDTADKLQQIKDAQNELYNFTKNLKTQAYDEIPRLYQQMANKIIQIDRQMYLSDEEKMELRKLTYAKYMELINKQAQIAKDTDIMYSKEALSAITDGSDYSYRSVFDPKTGKVTTYLGYGEKSVEQWAEDNKGIMDRMMQYLEEKPYAENKKAFYDMIYGNDDAMLPTWKTGVGQFIDKIIGAGGLQPLMQGAMDKLQQQVENYRVKFDNLADAADIDTDRIGEGVDIDIEKTQELIGTNEEMLRSYQNVYDEMMSYWIPTLENYIDKHRELKEAIDAITEAYKLQMQEQRRAAEAATQVAGAAAASIGDTSLFDGTHNQVHPDVSYGGGYGGSYGGDTVVIDPGAYGGGGGFGVGSTVRFLSGRYTADSYGGGTSGDASLGSYVTITYTNPGAPRPYHISGADYWGNYSDLGWVTEDQLGYKSGGYTGDWNSPDGRWALLHQKELILNAQDTENILNAVNIVRNYNDALNKLQDYQNELLFGSGISSIYSNKQQTPIEQIVHINADFPAVQDYREIELAFENLANRASQYLFTSR